jgi:transposase
MKAYSEDLRRKIVQAVGGGMGKSEVAPTLGVSLSSIKRYVGMAHQGRSLTPKKPPGLRPKIDKQGKRLLQADLKARPAATLPQRREFLQRMAGVRVRDSTISRAIKRLGWSRKKIGEDRWVPPNATNGSGRPGE